MKFLTAIAKELRAREQRREKVIRASREILHEAKRIIFTCHNGDVKAAQTQLTVLTAKVKKTEQGLRAPLSARGSAYNPGHDGSWAAALEEYLEAWFFVQFVAKKKLVEPRGITAPADVYVGALADFTGEVLRAAVIRGSERNVKALQQYKNVVAQVVEFMLPLYITGMNRQKLDQAKKNLKRLEEIIYEVTIRI